MVNQNKLISKKEINQSYWIYQLGCELSNSYERLQSLVFCASMIPVIRKIYKDDKEMQKEALRRHLNFFNTEGTIGSALQGVVIAMEEEKAQGAEITDASITSIKTGLMGPLAGIGDSIIWAAVMPIIISIFIPIANEGSILGGIGPIVLYTAITLYISYVLIHQSYRLGKNSILALLKNGKIKQVIHASNILGMIMMGALSASYVKLSTPFIIKTQSGTEIVIQEIFDQIFKGVLPLTAVFLIYFFLQKKGPKFGPIISTIVLISLLASFLGLL